MNYEECKFMIEAISGGKNTILLDDIDRPSIMVRIPKQTYASLGISSSMATHPAWIVNGVEKDYIYIGKYQAIIENERAYSLPNREPHVDITFEEALECCEKKGRGWHLITNAEWAAIALWCKVNGYLPGGNNDYGACLEAPHQRGIPTCFEPADPEKTIHVATGSGPKEWAHDKTNEGIFDLNGNVWERVGGLRLYNGEIQIIPNNDAAAAADQTVNSSLWKAITAAGELVEPGVAGTLKLDYTEAPTAQTTKVCLTDKKLAYAQTEETVFGQQVFGNLTAKLGVKIPDIVKALALMPDGTGYDGSKLWFRNNEERLPSRGGRWSDGAGTGVFSLGLFSPRSWRHYGVGFRVAYVEL